MTPAEYVAAAIRTESCDFPAIIERITLTDTIRLDHAAKGMCTEAGEFTDALKKYIYYGRALDLTNLREEIGDQLWYIAIAVYVIQEILKDGIGLSEIMTQNIAKLRVRYPQKFESEQALDRDLEAERKTLVISSIVCASCGSPAEWIEDEYVWRHKGEPHEIQFAAQAFCTRYGYPIAVKPANKP